MDSGGETDMADRTPIKFAKSFSDAEADRYSSQWNVIRTGAVIAAVLLSGLAAMLGVTSRSAAAHQWNQYLPAQSAESQLAAKYAPIAELKEKSSTCRDTGEGFLPAPVDVI